MAAVPKGRARSPPLPPPPPAVFYGPLEPGNPVLDSFESDLRHCLGCLRRKRDAEGNESAKEQELHRRGATALFNCWNKYKPRVPDHYYNEKLVKIGDQLMEMKEYKLAVVQCYGRYLQQISNIDLDMHELDMYQFQSNFFPNGFRDKTAALTFHVLQARNICIYQMVCDSDTNLLNQQSLKTCFNLLSIFRIIMQVTLPHEHLCWLVYNGTIHMYTICRHLMTVGQSAKVLEYLLWATVCMETSVPLLAVHYLTWRATLYAAVCQCYYDCQHGINGEVFARRALSKIDELKQMECLSSGPQSTETKHKFKEATVKMATMIFKRSVFEPRRRPRSLFRPRQRLNLKEAQHLPWPRTITERLLMEIFDCSSSQFLAILEALFDKTRRTLTPGPPVIDEPEVRDVVSELFFAGLDILAGGGMSSVAQGNLSTVFSTVISGTSTLMQLILTGKNSVSGAAALRLIKMAFSYEEWDVFDQATSLFFAFLQSQNNPEWSKEEAELKLLLAMQPLVSPRKPRHNLCIQGNNIRELAIARSPGRKLISFREVALKMNETTDELFLLAKTLFFCVCTSKKVPQPDREMIIDATVFLWQRCKVGIQKIQMSGNAFLKFNQKYQTSKWVHILHIINDVIHTINLGDTNAVIMAEVALRLSAVMENIADVTIKSGTKLVRDPGTEFCIGDMPSLIQKCPSEQFRLAYEYLDRAINAMNRTQLVIALPDGLSVFDNCCEKLTLNDQDLNACPEYDTTEKPIIGNNFVMDLHLELIQAQHRVAVKLLNLAQDIQNESKGIKYKFDKKVVSQLNWLTEPAVMNKIKKNKLSKALFLMQKATLKPPIGLPNFSPKQLLEEAFILIQKAETEQSVLCVSLRQSASTVKSKVPPPPILLSRSHCSMVFKPAPFISPVKVSWYSIFGCIVEGSNPKVRLNSYNLKNTAEAVPADDNCVLEVNGLEVNEKYIFAVVAYSADGTLIGDGIGEATKPILAYPPLSAATVRAYLIQCAFQIENYALAKKAFQPLWDYFVSVPYTQVTDVKIISSSNRLTISQHRLSADVVVQASPNLLYLFVRSIFIMSAIRVNDGALFCDTVSFSELKYNRQVARLNECERMLVAVELSSWLNDVQYALQSVVHCYGLLVPLIFHRVASVPIIQVIIKCLTVLQEIPLSVFQRKSTACYESLQHMIACTSFFSAKVLRSWKEYELAIVTINYGKRLLDSSQSTSPCVAGDGADEVPEDEIPSKKLKSQMAAAEKINENLEALENSLLRLTKPGQELTGEEDPLFLYPVVANWHIKTAFKEVLKFKRSPRFLEYFVQVLCKALNEEKFSRILEWADEVVDYLKRRNRYLLGIKRLSKRKKKGRSSLDAKKYATMDFQRVSGSTAVKKIKCPKKKELPKYCGKQQGPGRLLDALRKEKEELRRIACQKLVQKLNTLLHVFIRRRRFFRICIEETPWRSQMNIYLGIAHFNLFTKQLEELYNIEVHSLQNLNSYEELDPEIFSLNNSGTIVVRAAMEDQMKAVKSPLLNRTPSAKLKTKTDDVSEYSSKSNEKISPQARVLSDKGLSILKERERALAYAAVLEHFAKMFLHFKRAVVLSHRGGHWTLLQNACRSLCNYTKEVQSILKHSQSFRGPFPINWELFLHTIWLPYYMASDMLLDMIVDLQASHSVKIIEPEGDFCVPSCMGGIEDEKGGSNLSFEYPFDDVTVVDLRGVRNLVLQTLEMLFHLKKWESIVYIGMQFNTVTHERYSEQVTPLLVFAQRKVQERIQLLSDSDTSLLDFNLLVTDTGNQMRCRDFIAKKLHVASKYNARNHEPHWDSTEENQARPLVSVPLDVTDTLKCFRESLEKAKHHSRSLKYSRKLLLLFLANTQENVGRLSTSGSQIRPLRKVEFTVGAELTYQPEPPDLSEESFAFISMIQSRPIPRSKLSIVVSSYEQTLEALQTNNQQGLRVQALHELGNLHFYAGNKRSAFKCWCQGLDGALNIVDALNHWQKFDGLSHDAADNLANKCQGYCGKFISRAGIWGCLQGAILAAKIARHLLLYDIKLRTKACLLSAVLFKSLFSASLPHPNADCDFARYEIDQLIPGIDLFMDNCRADVMTVVAYLSFIIFELHCSKQNLTILPLFTLYQYFVSEVCRNAIKCIEGRILKIKVLTDLGFFSDALHELCILNFGEKIPWKLPTAYKLIPKPPPYAKFDSSEPLLTSVNLQALEEVFNRPLHPIWVSVCEPQTINNLMLAKTHFVICLSATINCIPEKVMKTTYCTDPETGRKAGKNTEAYLKGFITTQKREFMIVELERYKDTLSLAMLKGILLAEAEERINYILENVQSKYGTMLCQCSATELETIMEAKLQLAVIAQQRFQTAFSAALAFSAIKLLQDANVFRKTPDLLQDIEKSDNPCDHLTYIEESCLLHNIIAREHMNIHLWLRCRLALVTAITAQVRGIETMKENELTECSCLIREVQMEAEAFNDVEILAEMMMQAVILGLQKRQPVADIKLRLQDIFKLLEEKTLISPPASLTLVQSMLLLADIMRIQTGDVSEPHSSKTDQLDLLTEAHRLVIKQLFLLGEFLEHHTDDPTFTTLAEPLKNIYLPHIRLLAKVKMRLGHALALELFCTSKIQNQLQWLPILSHTETALQLCRLSGKKDLELEAELLFRKGKIERQIIVLANIKSTLAVESFLEAIKLSLKNYQDYGLIRRSYLEIALLYFYLVTNKEEALATNASKGRKFKTRPSSKHLGTDETKALEMYRVQAWIAVRAAAQVSEAIMASQQLIGKKAVKLYHVRERIQQNIPEFALLDLSSSYKDFLDDAYDVSYKSPLESSAQCQETDGTESVPPEDSQDKVKITWVHLIRYNTYLTRCLNMSPLHAAPKAGASLFAKEDVLGTSVFDTGTILRLTEMHNFLKTYLPIYSSCCLQDPPNQLQGFEKPCFSLTTMGKTSPEMFGMFPKVLSGKISSTIVCSSEVDFHYDNKATSVPMKEFCAQWYLPSLETPSKEGDTMVLFIYAYNTKSVRIVNINSFNSANVYCGQLWMPLNSVIDIRDKLSDLKLQIEMLIQSAVTSHTQSEAQMTLLSTRSKSNIAKVSLDEKTEEMVKQCLSEIKTLFWVGPNECSPITEIPFDITLPAIKNLGKLFEPANGCVITAGSVFNWIISLLT